MKILVIFTGGTIGCGPANQAGVLIPEGNRKRDSWEDYYLLSYYKNNSRSHLKDTVEFDVMEPLCILSENMTVFKWNILAQVLKKVNFGEYNGVIITHGSDTLAYSAAFLGTLLEGTAIPTVLIGADRNLYDPNTNGHLNFEAALDFIGTTGICGVFVAFGYERDKTVIYRSDRIKQSQAFIDRFESMDGVDYGYVKRGRFIRTCEQETVCVKEPILYQVGELTPYVTVVSPYIGMDYSSIVLDRHKTRAVLHTVYHSFTACTDGMGTTSILWLEKRCREENILLCLAPFSSAILQGGEHYESVSMMRESNIHFLCEQTVECAYARLLLAVNLYSDEKRIIAFLGNS